MSQPSSLTDRRAASGGMPAAVVMDPLADIIASVPLENQWKLDREIDFEHPSATGQIIPKHLGKISESMTNWEGAVADHLGLTVAERSDIHSRNIYKPAQQR